MAVILCAAAAQKFTVEIRILGAGFDKDRDQCLDIDCSEWFGSGSFILLLSMDIQEACSLRATAYGRQHRMPCRRELGTPSSNSEDRFGRRRVRLDARSMSDKELDPYEIMLSLIATKGAPGTDEKYRAVMRAVDALHEYHHDPNQGRPARHRQLGRGAPGTYGRGAGEEPAGRRRRELHDRKRQDEGQGQGRDSKEARHGMGYEQATVCREAHATRHHVESCVAPCTLAHCAQMHGQDGSIKNAP
eukprot:scaffold7218_cov613-Prasinococcus_capsulatus_cf.AAC.4